MVRAKERDPRKGEVRLDSLTSLRFFACLMVVLYHFGRKWLSGLPVLGNFVERGYLGVSFFFVLSGFVLVAVYGAAAQVRPIDLRKFYVARFARVYPVFFVSILLVLVPYAINLRRSAPELPVIPAIASAAALSLGLVSSWVPGHALTLNSPSWTLSVEAFFYLLFPFILGWMLRARGATRRWAVLGAVAFGVFVPYVILLFDPRVDADSPYRTTYCMPPFHLGSFLVGCEAGLIYLRRDARSVREKRMLLVATALAFVTVVLAIQSRSLVSDDLLHKGVLAIPFGAILLWVAENDARLAVLRLPPLVLLGEASYGAYLLHFPVYFAAVFLGTKLGLPTPNERLDALLAFLVLLEVVALLSYRLFEAPMRTLLRARLNPKGSRENRTVPAGIPAESAAER